MNATADPLAQFRVRRRLALWLGVATPAAVGIAAILAYQLGLLPGIWVFAVLGACALLHFLALWFYRCPFCNAFPEPSDFPLYNPEQCGKCGSRLIEADR